MASKSNLKSACGALLRLSGLSWLMREVVHKRSVAVVALHNPRPQVFEAQIKYLTQYYTVIPLSTLVDALAKKSCSHLPPKSMVITLDDGHRGNSLLLPIIEKYNIPLTIFACSHIVGTHRKFWFLEPEANVCRLKSLPNQERLFVLKVKSGFNPEMEYEERQALSREEMESMKPLVDFGSHSCLHPVLPQCEDNEAAWEITASKKTLEEHIGRPVPYFAYPHGFYGTREMMLVKQAGYQAALAMNAGWNGPHQDLFAIKRWLISDNASPHELAGELSGVFSFIRSLLK